MPPNTLLVVDASFDVACLREWEQPLPSHVILFPLTSRQSLLEECRRRLIDRGFSVEIAQAAALVDSAAVSWRQDYLRWVAGLPDALVIDGLSFHEYFAADQYASLWWFSLIAEKSPLKSNSFNALAQLAAVAKVVRDHSVGRIICCVGNASLCRAMRRFARDSRVEFLAPGSSLVQDMRQAILSKAGTRFVMGASRALWYAVRTVARGLALRLTLMPFPIRVMDRSLLVIGYWPYFDQAAARRGIFRHRQAGQLMESLQAEGQDVSWCMIWNSMSVGSMTEALLYARKFISSGARIIFPEMGLGFMALLRSMLVWVRCAWRFYRTEPAIAAAHRMRGLAFYELFRDDWYSSFAGVTGCIGLLYYESFRSLFRRYPAKACLYYCEMLEWEKALLCAAQAEGRPQVTAGYQSGTISPMLLNYFHAPEEVSKRGLYAMPRPDRILCNGDINRRRLAECGWAERDLEVVEAVRYDHIKKSLKEPVPPKQNLILVVFSVGIIEGGAELGVVYQALRDFPGAEVRLRPHPCMPLSRIIEQSDFALEHIPFPVADGPLDEWLGRAKIVIAGGETGVSVEALALGCQVVTLQIPEHFNMSPLRGMDLPGVRCVMSPKELRRVVEGMLAQDEIEPRDPVTVAALGDFFYFSEGTDEPRRFVNILKSLSNTPAGILGGV